MTNDAYESYFGVITDIINSFRNIRLINIGGMEVAKKNGDFALGFKKINKHGKSKPFVILNLTFFYLEFQEWSLFNIPSPEMLDSLIRVASKFN